MSKEKIKIAIVGLGGVGGYMGGMLASYYESSEDVEVYFFARESSAGIIRENGLLLKTTSGEYTAHPKGIFTDATNAPKMDYIIYSTKSYSVESLIPLLKSISKDNTVIVSFMNGVMGSIMIKENLPDCVVWDGCVFIMSHIESPGVIVENGGWILFYFGCENCSDTSRQIYFEKICRTAGVNAVHKEDIVYRVWNKFSYISPLATISTAYNLTNGDIVDSKKFTADLMSLYDEFRDVAKAKGINMPHDIGEVNFKSMLRTPRTMTTSMQRDYYSGRESEYESLTGYIVRQGSILGVDTPFYTSMYDKIKNR